MTDHADITGRSPTLLRTWADRSADGLPTYADTPFGIWWCAQREDYTAYDRADLIEKMRKMADLWDAHADIYGAMRPNYRITATLLREAVKAMEGGE